MYLHVCDATHNVRLFLAKRDVIPSSAPVFVITLLPAGVLSHVVGWHVSSSGVNEIQHVVRVSSPSSGPCSPHLCVQHVIAGVRHPRLRGRWVMCIATKPSMLRSKGIVLSWLRSGGTASSCASSFCTSRFVTLKCHSHLDADSVVGIVSDATERVVIADR